MSKAKRIAGRFREVTLNGLWVANTNLKDQLAGTSVEMANTQIASLNTIAALTFHLNYYIAGILNVFKGGTLDIRDKYSFDMPPVETQADWEQLTQTLWRNAEQFAEMVERMPDEQLEEVFADPKYGTYERNIEGMIEHGYYHLGQITLIKKMAETI